MTASPLHILLVDDDPHVTRTLSDILSAVGYRVDRAGSAAEALACLEGAAYDCVLSDIRMPDTDGVELHRAIRARWPDTPVALMTAYTGDARTRRGLSDGAAAVLSKPIDMPRLLEALRRLARRRALLLAEDDPDRARTPGQVLGDALRTP